MRRNNDPNSYNDLEARWLHEEGKGGISCEVFLKYRIFREVDFVNTSI